MNALFPDAGLDIAYALLRERADKAERVAISAMRKRCSQTEFVAWIQRAEGLQEAWAAADLDRVLAWCNVIEEVGGEG